MILRVRRWGVQILSFGIHERSLESSGLGVREPQRVGRDAGLLGDSVGELRQVEVAAPGLDLGAEADAARWGDGSPLLGRFLDAVNAAGVNADG